MFGQRCQSTNIVFNALNKKYNVEKVILELKEPLKKFTKRRINRLGVLTVIGQFLFQIFIVKLLHLTSQKRLKEIINNNQLNTENIPSEKIFNVQSINSNDTLNILKKLNPDLIVINGTRIISKKILRGVNCKLINIHAGITPMYRGVHGAYWALVNNDALNSGVTVHFVDEGIDTGNIIEQKQVIPTSKDNFVTYPLLQLSTGINLLIKVVQDYFDNNINIKNYTGVSNLYYHPTIWQYIYFRFTRKVK